MEKYHNLILCILLFLFWVPTLLSVCPSNSLTIIGQEEKSTDERTQNELTQKEMDLERFRHKSSGKWPSQMGGFHST